MQCVYGIRCQITPGSFQNSSFAEWEIFGQIGWNGKGQVTEGVQAVILIKLKILK